MSATSASFSWDHFFSRRSSRRRLPNARLILAGELKRLWSSFVDYESIEYK
jgi:hypothetical protein